MQADKRLIVALDFHTLADVKNIVNELNETVVFYKVGMELFYSVGPEVISYLKEKEKNIFLDLKLHDIPNTVANSMATLTRLGVNMINLHTTGGYTMMAEAVKAVKEAAHKYGVVAPAVLGVTVLTSINEVEWRELGQTSLMQEQVVNLAKLAHKAGLDGVVASPQEASAIRTACGPEFMIVTPGVRPQGSAVNDQARIATPSEALKIGSSHLVVGRPITKAVNPRQAAEQIVAEMREI